MLKFIAQTTGDPFVALNYVDGGMSQGNEQRDEIRLIDGSPDDFLHVASGLTFSETFKSCVLSWSPGDAPSDQQLDHVLDDFKKVAFAGMDPNDFCYCIYLHRKQDRVDVHILVANVHLGSGKHFNIAPPKWMHSFDPLRDKHNARWGWASPKDPKLARLIRPVFEGYGSQTAPSAVTPKTSKDAANRIQEAMLALAVEGAIKDRASLLLALAAHGVVNRGRSKDFVSVIPHGMAKPVRLRGVIFQEDFSSSMLKSLGPTPRPARTAADHEADKDPVEEAAAQARFDAAVARRARDNYNRYLAPRQRASKKKPKVTTAEATDLTGIDLAIRPTTESSVTADQMPQEGSEVTEPGPAMQADAAVELWESFLKEPSQDYKDQREQVTARAISGFFENLRERTSREFERLARAIQGLTRSVQDLAGRIVRRRQAERARTALECAEGVAARARREAPNGNP